MTEASPNLEDHRKFLNSYYGWARSIYDVTRKYYLLGRDTCLRQLAAEPWVRLIEIGPGTGRNLRMLRRLRPDAMLGGVEASDEMLEHAQQKCPWARFEHGFAETCDYTALLGGKPDRILFSYCLSMVTEKQAALDNALAQLAPGGEVVVVDFSDCQDLPGLFGRALRKWLNAFHVVPLPDETFDGYDARLKHGGGRYFIIARVRPSLES